MRRRLGEFVTASHTHDEGLLDQAENKGVEVSEARFRLQEASTALIEVRNLTHGLASAGDRGQADRGRQGAG